jgi:hypothetical protein
VNDLVGNESATSSTSTSVTTSILPGRTVNLPLSVALPGRDADRHGGCIVNRHAQVIDGVEVEVGASG